MRPQSLKWYGSSDGPIQFECPQGVFVMLIDVVQKTARALWVSDQDFSSSQFEERFKSCLQGLDRVATEVKVIGAPEALLRFEAICRKESLKVVQSVHRQGEYKIQFFPHEGRARLAKKTRVLIVDDSKTIRILLHRILSSDPDLEVVGAAEKPSEALPMISSLKPDVITLDIHMPEMDGVQFLKSYLPRFPIPTVMISSISMEEGPAVLNALEAGAVDYVQKPSQEQIPVVGPLIIEKVKMAASAKMIRQEAKVKVPNHFSSQGIGGTLNTRTLIAIGSSTGGTEALKQVLTMLPAQIPPIVIVQHIPAVFSKAFADRMNQLCPFEVLEAKEGDEVKPGRVLIAAGGTQMRVKKFPNGDLKVMVDDSAPVNRHKPSVDVLFDSVAQQVGKNVIGVILTGMGADGAKGMLNLKKAGARTIAQSEKTCVVYGMPKEAVKLGGVDQVVDLDDIAGQLVQWLSLNKAA